MTQRIFSRKSVPFNMFLFTIKKSLGFTAVATVLALILSPFYAISWLNDIKEDGFIGQIEFFSDFFFPASVILSIGACAFLLVLLYINFNFLFGKSSSDAYHSMPITRAKLLIARFSASYVCALIPLVAAYIGFVAVAGTQIVNSDISLILKAGFFTAFMMLFCGAFTLLFIVTSGTVFDSLVSFAVVNIGLPLIMFLILDMCETNLYGCVSLPYDTYIQYISPFAYALISLLSFLSSPHTVNCFDNVPTIVVAFLAALLLLLSVILYKNRKSEKAGEAYAYKFMQYIIGTVVSIVCYFILGAIFANDRLDPSFWASGAIGAVLGAVIYNAVTNRGFKKIKAATLSAVIALAIIFLSTAAVKFDFFGFEDYVPKNNDITRVTVYYRGMEMKMEDVTHATVLHKKIVAEGPEENEYTESGIYNAKITEYVSFSYKLNDGTTVERRYHIPFKFATEEKTKIINDDLVRTLKEEFSGFKGEEFTLEGNFDKYNNNDTRYVVTVTREEAESLIDAYIKDVSKADKGVLFSDNYYDTPTLHIHGSYVSSQYMSGKNEYTEYDSFNFSFYCAEEYTQFQSILNSIDMNARNEAYEQIK